MASNNEAKLNSLTLEYWDDRWNNENIPWHETQMHPDLSKITFAPNSRIFFPLCGKAVDMRLLADMGHRVVGVEYSERAVIDFFTEQQLQFKRFPCEVDPNYEVFQALTTDLMLIRGDFFSCDDRILGGKFDAIWDRGSHIAINPCDRVKYARVIKSLVTSQCTYYIQGIMYDQREHAGPPFSLDVDMVRSLYGEEFDISIREECSREDSAKAFNLAWWKDVKYSLTPKQSS